jgi:mRNA interferase RelE/StbE
MEFYKVDFAKSVRKDFKKIPKTEASKILDVIEGLSKNPRSYNSKKLKGEKLYRIRVGNYRVVYYIQDKVMLVFIVKLGHRNDIHRNT